MYPYKKMKIIILTIGWILILWNSLLLIIMMFQNYFGLNMSFFESLVISILSPGNVFIILGFGLVLKKNWARLGCTYFMPLHSIINIVLGFLRNGVATVLDYLPSFFLSLIVILILNKKHAKEWFIKDGTIPIDKLGISLFKGIPYRDIFVFLSEMVFYVFYASTFLLHLWTTKIAYEESFLSTVITFCLPVLAEFFWFFRVGLTSGFNHPYCLFTIGYLLILITGLFVLFYSLRKEKT